MNIKIIILIIGFFLCNGSEAQFHFLVFGGKTGWIGKKIVKILNDQGYVVTPTQVRLEQREAVERVVSKVKPDCIINTAGITGRPNVDWCEEHKPETIRANLIGALNLADVAFQQNIHFINMGTGCIYTYDADHPKGSGIGFTEEDPPNFRGSFYSHTKCMLDDLLMSYPNVLNLRLRMPISDDFYPRSFAIKITHYQKVVNIPNSMSVLSDLLPLISEMAKRRLTGNYNFVNPGAISHNEILDLYKKYIDSEFVYQNFTIEEQNKILKAARSNCELDASKLLKAFPQIPHIKKSIVGVFERMKEFKEKAVLAKAQ